MFILTVTMSTERDGAFGYTGTHKYIIPCSSQHLISFHAAVCQLWQKPYCDIWGMGGSLWFSSNWTEDPEEAFFPPDCGTANRSELRGGGSSCYKTHPSPVHWLALSTDTQHVSIQDKTSPTYTPHACRNASYLSWIWCWSVQWLLSCWDCWGQTS